MTTKITLILVASLLVPACMSKKQASRPKDAGAEAAAAPTAEARQAGDPGTGETDPKKAGDPGAAAGNGAALDAGAAEAPQAVGGRIADDGGITRQPGPAKIPDVPKTLVITISMGAQDYDVVINPETTQWRIPMKAKAAELLSLAQRAKAAPDAKDGQVTVFLGNSVDPAVGQAMMEALRNAGFKTVKMSVPRPP